MTDELKLPNGCAEISNCIVLESDVCSQTKIEEDLSDNEEVEQKVTFLTLSFFKFNYNLDNFF